MKKISMSVLWKKAEVVRAMRTFFKKRRLCYRKKMLISVLDYVTSQLGRIDGMIPSFAEKCQEVNIAVIPPQEGQDYYTLVTIGMGACRLRTPKGLPNRLELAIRLPADWELENDRERWFWPVRWLQVLARMPMRQNTWFTHGHTMDANRFLLGEEGFRGFALHSAGKCPLKLGKKDTLEILYLLPVYEGELEFARAVGTDKLFERLGHEICLGSVDMQRKNTCQ